MLSAYSSEHSETDVSEKWKLFFDRHLTLDIQTTAAWHCKSLIAKTFDQNTLKIKALSPI